MKRFLFLLAYCFAVDTQAQVQVPLNNATWKIPFVAISSTDHVTEKTDVSSVTCRRSKNGTDGACGGSTAELSDTNSPGQWEYSLAASDTDTAGPVSFRFSATGMDPTRALIQVGGVNVASGGIAAASFAAGAIDAAAVADGAIDAGAIASNTLTAAKFAAQGTAQAVGASTLTLASGETYGDDAPNGALLYIVSASTGAGQSRRITDYVASTKVATVDAAWSPSLTGTVTYNVIADVVGGATAAEVWASGTRTLTDKTGFALSGTQTFDMTGNITGNLSGSVGSVTAVSDKTGYSAACTLGTNAITAASVSSEAGSKLADIVLRRTSANIEASSDGDTLGYKSLYGAIANQTHKLDTTGGMWTVYKADGTTQLTSKTLTASSSAAPITGKAN